MYEPEHDMLEAPVFKDAWYAVFQRSSEVNPVKVTRAPMKCTGRRWLACCTHPKTHISP
jgi:hypothetical protein